MKSNELVGNKLSYSIKLKIVQNLKENLIYNIKNIQCIFNFDETINRQAEKQYFLQIG